MGAPMLIPAIGAVAGAALKPSNPLQGALLGAAAGYTGGQALGLTGVAPAVVPGAAGLNPAAAAGIDATSQFGSYLNTTGANASLLNPASAAGIQNTQFGNYLNNTGAGTVPQAIPQAAPSWTDKFSMMGKSAYENPMMTAQALNATNSLLQPEQMPSPAPAMPLQAGKGVKPFDPMAALNPYQQTVVGGQPISLI
jgi:hypothetical protein